MFPVIVDFSIAHLFGFCLFLGLVLSSASYASQSHLSYGLMCFLIPYVSWLRVFLGSMRLLFDVVLILFVFWFRVFLSRVDFDPVWFWSFVFLGIGSCLATGVSLSCVSCVFLSCALPGLVGVSRSYLFSVWCNSWIFMFLNSCVSSFCVALDFVRFFVLWYSQSRVFLGFVWSSFSCVSWEYVFGVFLCFLISFFFGLVSSLVLRVSWSHLLFDLVRSLIMCVPWSCVLLDLHHPQFIVSLNTMYFLVSCDSWSHVFVSLACFSMSCLSWFCMFLGLVCLAVL